MSEAGFSSAPRGGIPRWIEVPVSCCALILLSPLLLLLAAGVKLGSPGPVLFRQTRIGRFGRKFTLLKFRTMTGSVDGPRVTARGDSRITRFGRFLRRTKLDELPSLWNVIRGDLAWVGPRPEVAEYVDLDNPDWKRVLSVRPGLTDPVTLRLRNEEALLADRKQSIGTFYVQQLLPWKVSGYLRYVDSRTALRDLGILWRTAIAIMKPSSISPPSFPGAQTSSISENDPEEPERK